MLAFLGSSDTEVMLQGGGRLGKGPPVPSIVAKQRDDRA